MVKLFIRLLPALLLALSPVPQARAEGGKSILVFDASGSMWGQIEGEAKITIAQRVLVELLDTLPADQELGLVAYGHRRKGDCGDIELMVPPGPGTREEIRAAVLGISPKGKTPLSQAVIDAAEALKYQEEAATVILLSDGIETCDLDPCAVGRALEEAGINFTAHVIGFDVAAKKDQEQLRCLAENTGGRFLTAANAAELAEALQQVSVEAPAPAELQVLFQATDGADGPVIDEPLVWSVTAADGTAVLTDEQAATVGRSLPPGSYEVEVLRPSDEATASETLTLEAGDGQVVVTLVLEAALPSATLQAPDQAPAGSTVTVAVSGPLDQNDQVRVAAPGSKDAEWLRYEVIRGKDRVEIELPTLEGPYELRYVDGRGRVLARRAIEATAISGSLSLPATAPAGAKIAVGWTGPGYPGDYISVVEVGKPGHAYINYVALRDKPSVELLMPLVPGTYEVRYVLRQDHRVLVSQSIVVEAVAATLDAPASATAGSTVEVTWTGPDYANDYISVAEPGARDSAYVNYVRTREGSPAQLLLPPEAGTYEIRYVASQDHTVLARAIIEVTAVSATLSAPATAVAGSTVEVAWTGPDYANDYISVAETGARDSAYINYVRTREGSPAELLLPPEAGTYEIRYVASQDHTVLARAIIEVTAVSATLSMPVTAKAGSTVEVAWTGPDYANDYISVAEVGARDSAYIYYVRTREGSPAALRLPPQAGTYEVRYVVSQDHTVLARETIEVTAE